MNQDRDTLLGGSNSCTASLPNHVYDHIDTQIITQESTSYADNSKKFKQLFAGFTATLSALSAGLVLGWTSPILDELTHSKYKNITIDNNQMGWIGSFVTLGAMFMCIPTGFICDLIGRKKTLLLLIIPFSVGWSLILFGQNITTLYFGRIITGMAVGACCIAAPLYTSEIAHKNLRGAMGSFFQLMVTVGIFLAYLFGKLFHNVYHFTVFCAIFPCVFVLLFAFQPESPTYLLKRGCYDKAKKCLVKLRGENYDIDSEMNEIEGNLKITSQTSVSLRDTIRQKSVRKAILISFGLMFFQQLSGINAVILYTTDIFKCSSVKLDPNTATILVGAFLAIATLVSSITIDKLGRRFLLFISASVISINTLLLAVYFTLKNRTDLDAHILLDLSFIPVGALCLFVIAFSLGLGPIPWLISSEICPMEIRSMVGSAAGTFNWFLAFLITKFYLEVCEVIGQDTTFYIFTAMSIMGTLFVYFVVVETKGKSISEIQNDLR